tara:strand:+ start:388 stop:1023 length:636 start_codon:yes stop_codon:yes gene_type:complete
MNLVNLFEENLRNIEHTQTDIDDVQLISNHTLNGHSIINADFIIEAMRNTFSPQFFEDSKDRNFCFVSVTGLRQLIPNAFPVFDTNIGAFFKVFNGVPVVVVNIDTPFVEAILRHEVTHYKQFERGDFLYVETEATTYWKGEPFTDQVIAGMGLDKIDPVHWWRHLPWELEAYATMYTDEEITNLRNLIGEYEKEHCKSIEAAMESFGRTV